MIDQIIKLTQGIYHPLLFILPIFSFSNRSQSPTQSESILLLTKVFIHDSCSPTGLFLHGWPPLPNAHSPRPSFTRHLHLHVRFTPLHAISASVARFARVCLFLEINAIQVYFLVSDDCIHLSEIGDVTAALAIRMPCPTLHLSPVFSPFSLTILSPSQ